MTAAVDWAALVPAGAFVLGAVLGAFAAVRLVRALVSVFDESAARTRRARRDPPED